MTSPSILWQRAALVQAVRAFFIARGYLEVDTPVRIPAPAPEPYIIPQESGGWFLQTSPELCMKRLLARGVPKLFQVCKCFRKRERGARHLPEFTMLEWYRAGIDYQALMTECEELIRHVAQALGHGRQAKFGRRLPALAGPWERLTVAEAFARHAPVSMAKALERNLFDENMVTHIEPCLGIDRPTFLYDYPAPLGALARLRQDNSEVAERFELYMNGLELANGFSELTDGAEQRRRFSEDRAMIQALGRKPAPMPERFLAELDAMPEAAGMALGLDRLAMVFADAASIDEVLPFRPEDL